MDDAVLPEFELDCRDWIVSRPGEAGGSDVVDGAGDGDAPVLAVLSTLVIDDDLREATGAITVGLIEADDDLDDLAARPVRPGATACEVLDLEPEPGTRRYVMPAPAAGGATGGPRIALLAEFTVPADRHAELDRRVDALMGSFRWHAA